MRINYLVLAIIFFNTFSDKVIGELPKTALEQLDCFQEEHSKAITEFEKIALLNALAKHLYQKKIEHVNAFAEQYFNGSDVSSWDLSLPTNQTENQLLPSFDERIQLYGLAFMGRGLDPRQIQQFKELRDEHCRNCYSILEKMQNTCGYIPNRSVRDMVHDGITGAVAAGITSKSPVAVIIGAIAAVISNLAASYWDEYCELKDLEKMFESEYAQYYMCCKILRNEGIHD